MLSALLNDTRVRSTHDSNVISDKLRELNDLSQLLSFSLGDFYHTLEELDKRAYDHSQYQPPDGVSQPAIYHQFNSINELQPGYEL